MDDQTAQFEAQRPRLVRIAGRLLSDPAEAQDVVQQAWLRLNGVSSEVENLPAWLTTVTTRICLDRLRSKTPVPTEHIEDVHTAPDPAEDVALADTVGIALQIVLDRLTPAERVAFVLHDSFAVEFPTVAEILGITPVAARKLASRARNKIAQPTTLDQQPDWAVVDAFMTAARGGDFSRLLELLAPDVVVSADAAAVAIGTPAELRGRHEVTTFFNGAAHAALPIFVHDQPAAAWFHRGQAKVIFAFAITDGVVRGITFRAAPEALAAVTPRQDGETR